MAMTVNLWSFLKATNSTKKPSTTGTPLTCTLKDECSILNPSIEIQSIASPQSYNYAYISEFSRYYYITDWTYNKGIWTAHLTEDALATYKNYIGGSTQLITRSAKSTLRDEYLLDYSYMIKGDPTVEIFENLLYPDTDPFVHDLRDGCYVIGVVNQSNDKVYGGSVSYYVMDSTNLNLMKRYFMDFNNWTNTIDQTIQTISKFEFNPLQYIVSCNYFPISYTQMPRLHYDVTPPVVKEVQSIQLGWWNPPAITDGQDTFKAWTIGSKPIGSLNGWLNVPKHPSAATRGKYLNLDPYTKYMMTFRPFGEILIDSTFLIDSNFVYWIMKFDAISGEAILELFKDATDRDNDTPFATYRSVIATPVQLSQITEDLVGLAAGVVNMVSSAATGIAGSGARWTEMGGVVGTPGVKAGPIQGPVSGIIDGTISAVKATIPQVTSIGNSGTYVEYDYVPRLYALCYPITADATPRIGYPSYKYDLISASEGFTLCKDVKIELNATSEEINNIKQFMEAGFYYE